MPVITASIDPITRIEGHLKIDVQIDTVQGAQQVVEARCIGTLFRGFEKVLENRDPRDAPIITSRICGVCPTAHSMAAALTLDAAFGVIPPDSSRIFRNLVHAACFLESHILHFYLLSIPDYIPGLGMAPWLPGWNVGRRFDQATIDRIRTNVLEAINMRRKAHEMGAIFGGKLPHTPAYIGGGFTAVASGENKTAFQHYLNEITDFITNVYIPDVELVASLYNEYFSLGTGYGNLISFGVYELDAAGSTKYFQAGRLPSGAETALAVDTNDITEHVKHSWYDDKTDDLNPMVGDTLPQHPKRDGYSWLKAPRYDGDCYECGPLSRMAVQGEYPNHVSIMDRHLARAREALLLAQAMQGWLSELPTGESAYTPVTVPESGSSHGLTEAPRGALGHWLQIVEHKIARYQVLTPTCWNASPKDSAGQRGPLEEALVGIPIANVDEPIEVLRTLHAFDPCLDCATHVMRPGEEAKVFTLGPAPVAASGGKGSETS
jgi:hydrogenase large subunit